MWHLSFGFTFENLDVSNAFLQGDALSSVKTQTGEDRKAAMVPPEDVWDLLTEAWKLKMPYGSLFRGWAGSS